MKANLVEKDKKITWKVVKRLEVFKVPSAYSDGCFGTLGNFFKGGNDSLPKLNTYVSEIDKYKINGMLGNYEHLPVFDVYEREEAVMDLVSTIYSEIVDSFAPLRRSFKLDLRVLIDRGDCLEGVKLAKVNKNTQGYVVGFQVRFTARGNANYPLTLTGFWEAPEGYDVPGYSDLYYSFLHDSSFSKEFASKCYGNILIDLYKQVDSKGAIDLTFKEYGNLMLDSKDIDEVEAQYERFKGTLRVMLEEYVG